MSWYVEMVENQVGDQVYIVTTGQIAIGEYWSDVDKANKRADEMNEKLPMGSPIPEIERWRHAFSGFHDFNCESDYIVDAHAYTPCSCADRILKIAKSFLDDSESELRK